MDKLKRIDVRVPVPTYIALERIRARLGLRSLNAAVNHLIEKSK